MRVLLVDNYDSFTYNLAHLFGGVGADVDVVRNDDPRLNTDPLRGYDATVVGPGPGRPENAGMTCELIRAAAREAHPVLGVCLGEQAIGAVFGGIVDHAPRLMHGKVSRIAHDGTSIFRGIPSPFGATRYHSLALSSERFPAALTAIATSEEGVIQGVAHRELPLFGVQFHPESVLTEHGAQLARNFLEIAGSARR
ncbi:MAG: aminodeoxychorismate/anthranilate synthase component II [Candidatus Eremiobacteraeota bacterium]|nr:aminodeoxychorismate/anthranilate synthase component II [Candidatus Eremiobacteraeota bacterium]MBV8356304.1 aminodeoxychorismate/anthranilate synthase component II [Candidatus Eremiobacteraeota bacterium]